MNFLKALPAIILLSATLLSCGGGDKKEAEKEGEKAPDEKVTATDRGSATKLEGAWEIKRAEGSMAETNVGTVYEFKGNTLSFGKDGYTNPGGTTVTDSTFSFQATGNEFKFLYDYKFNGDTLVVEMQKSSGQIFHMVKK